MQFFTSAASAALGSSSPLTISVVLSRQPTAAPASSTSSASAAAPTPPPAAALPAYASGEAVSGEIKLMVASGKRFEHAGVRLELKGVVEAATEKAPYEFLSLVQEVTGAGALSGLQSLPFAFPAVDFPVESYSGAKARVRYVLRAIVATRGGGFGGGSGEQRREAEFAVRTPHAAAPALGGSGGVDAAALAADPDAPILLEVGIEDCLHIEFQYSRMRYHLADTVTGHIDFKQLGIKLRKMEVAVVRKENVGTPGSQQSTSDTLIKFEVMDGEPQVDDRIPIRVPLAALESLLTPTIAHDSLRLLSVRYYLYLALHDEQRAYFKTQEIFLWRKAEAGAATAFKAS